MGKLSRKKQQSSVAVEDDLDRCRERYSARFSLVESLNTTGFTRRNTKQNGPRPQRVNRKAVVISISSSEDEEPTVQKQSQKKVPLFDTVSKEESPVSLNWDLTENIKSRSRRKSLRKFGNKGKLSPFQIFSARKSVIPQKQESIIVSASDDQSSVNISGISILAISESDTSIINSGHDLEKVLLNKFENLGMQNVECIDSPRNTGVSSSMYSKPETQNSSTPINLDHEKADSSGTKSSRYRQISDDSYISSSEDENQFHKFLTRVRKSQNIKTGKTEVQDSEESSRYESSFIDDEISTDSVEFYLPDLKKKVVDEFVEEKAEDVLRKLQKATRRTVHCSTDERGTTSDYDSSIIKDDLTDSPRSLGDKSCNSSRRNSAQARSSLVSIREESSGEERKSGGATSFLEQEAEEGSDSSETQGELSDSELKEAEATELSDLENEDLQCSSVRGGSMSNPEGILGNTSRTRLKSKLRENDSSNTLGLTKQSLSVFSVSHRPSYTKEDYAGSDDSTSSTAPKFDPKDRSSTDSTQNMGQHPSEDTFTELTRGFKNPNITLRKSNGRRNTSEPTETFFGGILGPSSSKRLEKIQNLSADSEIREVSVENNSCGSRNEKGNNRESMLVIAEADHGQCEVVVGPSSSHCGSESVVPTNKSIKTRASDTSRRKASMPAAADSDSSAVSNTNLNRGPSTRSSITRGATSSSNVSTPEICHVNIGLVLPVFQVPDVNPLSPRLSPHKQGLPTMHWSSGDFQEPAVISSTKEELPLVSEENRSTSGPKNADPDPPKSAFDVEGTMTRIVSMPSLEDRMTDLKKAAQKSAKLQEGNQFDSLWHRLKLRDQNLVTITEIASQYNQSSLDKRKGRNDDSNILSTSRETPVQTDEKDGVPKNNVALTLSASQEGTFTRLANVPLLEDRVRELKQQMVLQSFMPRYNETLDSSDSSGESVCDTPPYTPAVNEAKGKNQKTVLENLRKKKPKESKGSGENVTLKKPGRKNCKKLWGSDSEDGGKSVETNIVGQKNAKNSWGDDSDIEIVEDNVKPKSRIKQKPKNSFEVSQSDMEIVKENVKPKGRVNKKCAKAWREESESESSSSEVQEVFSEEEPVTPANKGQSRVLSNINGGVTTSVRKAVQKMTVVGDSETSGKLSFLASLDDQITDSHRHPDALDYIKNFKKRKDELLRHLFHLFNSEVFELQLPADMSVTWNPRMTKTAGFCYYTRRLTENGISYESRIELSTKVCDRAGRVRDTLLHEMCHAAVWLVYNVRDKHGPFWKSWAQIAAVSFPEIPMVSRCHTYEISTKYIYRCTRCDYRTGRHSKSVNLETHRCPYCRSPLELLLNSTPLHTNGPGTQDTPLKSSGEFRTPRAPNAFALFVKEKYGSVTKKGMKHAEVMKTLSEQFALTKLK